MSEVRSDVTTHATSPEGAVTRVTVSGELDAHSAPQLREQVTALIAGGHNHVIIDLTAMEFIDSTGLGVLVGILRRARSEGGDLVLSGVRSHTRKVFDVTGLTDVFNVIPTEPSPPG